jgi:glucose/arabinose dehydrogenase/mono/diheme cytochrome c family protein
MPRSHRLIALLTILLAPWALAQNGDRRGEVQEDVPSTIKIPPAPPLSPADELATLKLPPGFHAELVAADPLIHDPISIQFAPDGKLWVLEMIGYMPDVDANHERDPVCDVVVLTDTDGDGRYDQRRIFADKLVMPRAISLVGDGLLVGEPTHLWFMRDTDGDGVADEKTEIANDYGNTNNPEHNANGLMWAMDNWIYSANYTARFRWQGGGKFLRDATVTRGQWGITQDDTGRIYYNSNSDPLRVDVIPSAYLKRNPNFNAAGTNVALAPATLKVWPGRVTPGINRGYKTLDAEGKMYAVTAACGPVIYRGALFPAEFHGDAFIAEPAGNLIKRIKLTEQDGLLRGANAYEGTEFITSTDERFRPVNLFNGPDGALYVVDFYRGIVQHRIYVTSFLRKQIEQRGLDKGIHYGRIWRVVPDGAAKPDFRFELGKAPSTTLVAKLSDPNGWVRDTAQRLLVERRDPAANAALAGLVRDRQQSPLARLHALWALDGVGGLDRAIVHEAIADPDARVAAAAVRLAEEFISAKENDEGLGSEIASLSARRHEPEVRLQLALTLPNLGVAAFAPLRRLAIEAGRQPFVADAIASGLTARPDEFVVELAHDPAATAVAGETLRYATSSVLKSGEAKSIDAVLSLLTDPTTPPWARTELLAGIRHFLPKAQPRFAGEMPSGGAPGRGGFGGARGAGRGPRGADARTFAGSLPAEPKPLLALAADKKARGSAEASQLLTFLKWPGKPGADAAAARPLTPDEEALFEQGKAQFATLCAACHQPNGQGLAGLAPPLIYSRWVLGDPRVLARIVLNGKVQDNLTMPPWKAALDDRAIAAVLTFVRRSWGHDADPVPVAVVAEARRDTAKREEPWSDPDLEELLQTLGPAGK